MRGRLLNKLSSSLFARFMFWTAALLTITVGMIIYFFQRQEVRNIDARSRREGVLLAQNIANLNLQALIWWDVETVRRNIASIHDPNILYIVFFDRYNNLLAATSSAEGREEITCCSRLPAEVDQNTVAYRPATFVIGSKAAKIMEIEIPVFAPGSAVRWGSVKIGLSLEQMEAEIRRMRTVLLAIGIGCGLLGIFGATVFTRRITHPLQELMAGTVRISRGDFSQPIPIRSRDEVGQLATQFNKMTTELRLTRLRMEEAQRKLIQAEKLASIGRIAATIAHEIRNPLTSVKLNIQKVLFSPKLEGNEREHLVLTQEGIEQIEKFIRELLNFTRVSELHLERFSLEEIISSALKLLEESFREKQIKLEVEIERDLPPLLVDGDKIRQVFLNLLRNAQEAVDWGGHIGLKVSRTKAAGKSWVRVLLSDDGCGIPEKDWENVFEPFFTTKSSGFGLGLANARKIVELHRGQIRVVKKEGRGACFEILFPCEVEDEFGSRH
jgi:signal transduction histidine kinase